MEPRKLKCMVHAPIRDDVVEFEFTGVPTQAELFHHIGDVVKKFNLDHYDIQLLNRIVDIHSMVLDFNKLDAGIERRKIEVVYTIRSFNHLPKELNYNTYILTRKVVDANTERTLDILKRFDEFYCSKDPELNQYSMSLPFVKSLTLL